MKSIKGIFDILFKLVVMGFIGALIYNYTAQPNDPPPLQPEKPRVVPPPAIPSVEIHFPEETWLEGLVRLVDGNYRIGKRVIEACNLRELRPNAAGMVRHEHIGTFNLGQVCDIFDYCQRFEYLNDPADGDYFASATESFAVNRGDCEDYSTLVASSVSAIGGYSVVVLCMLPNGEAHAFPEICLSKMNPTVVRQYLEDRYKVSGDNIALREDANGNIYLSLERAVCPGTANVGNEPFLRIHLPYNYIEKL